MTEKRPRNRAASVRERLHQVASRSGRPFQEVVQNFAMERFLYRLGSSPHGEIFILKGALMLAVWGGFSARPTRDIDLLARQPLDSEEVLSVFRVLCDEAVEEDGLVFDPSSVACAPIRAASEGLGHQVTFQGMLGSMRVAMQADIGFGDIVHPGPILAEYPVLLDLEGPRFMAIRGKRSSPRNWRRWSGLGSTTAA